MKRLILCYIAFFVISLAMLLANRPLWLSGGSDFSSFYAAGTIVRTGNGAQLYEFSTQESAQKQLFDRQIPLLFPHAPFETAIFAPLSFLNYRLAFMFWWAINQVLLLLTMMTMCIVLENGRSISSWSMAFFCLFTPLHLALIHGQDSVLVLFLLSIVLFGFVREHEFLTGFALSLTLFKPQLTIPIFVLMALKSSRKFTFGFISGTCFVIVLSMVLVGFRGLASFVPFLIRFNALPVELSGAFPSEMPNIRELLYHFGQKTSSGIVISISAAVLLMTAMLTRRTDGITRFAIAVAVGLVVSYHTMQHDLTLLIIPFLIAMDHFYGLRIVGFLRVAATLSSFAMMWIVILVRNPALEFAAIVTFITLIWMESRAAEAELTVGTSS